MIKNQQVSKKNKLQWLMFFLLFFTATLVNAQVTVTKSELNNLTSKQVDQPFTYVINYSTPNTSTSYTNLRICDELPQGLVFLGVSSPTGDMQSLSYNASTNSVCAVFNSPWNGGTGQFQIVVKFAATVFNGTVASNTAAVSSDQYNGTSNTINITAISSNIAPTLTTGVKITKSAYNPNVLDNSLVLYGLDYGIGGANPVSGFTVVDPLPNGFIPTKLQGASFAGTNVQFNMYYKTNVNSTYTLFPGSPYNSNSGVYETVNFLPANVRITEIKVEYPALPAGSLFTQENFRSLDINGYFDNSIANLANNAPIQNCGTITATGTGAGTQTSCVNQNYITGSRLDVAVGKNRSTWNNDLEPGGTYRYYINVGDGYANSADIINPVVADLLPPEFIYVGNATVTGDGFTSAGSPAPVVTTIPNFNGTGRTLVRWAWGPSNPLTIVRSGAAKYINISFDIQVRAVPTGTYRNDAYISVEGTPYTWSSLNIVPTLIPDTFDFDGDGNITETIANSYVPFNVVNPSGAALVSEKWVKGSLDAGYSRYPASGRTTPGGIADYKLKLKNAGTVALKTIKVIDIFPYVGDRGVIDLSARGSEWQPFFVGPVTGPTGATIYYSTSNDPCRTDINFTAAGCDAGAVWTTTLPTDITTVRSIKLDLGSIVLQPGDSLEFNWPMRAPIDAPTNGEIAWNSFGYTATRNDNNSVLPSSEPIKVGISVNPIQPAAYGDYVWYDANGDGIQNEPASNGINGVKVDLYFAKGATPNIATDSLVTFTITSSNAGNPGYYLFPVLNPGNYYAVFHKPLSNLVITTPNVGSDNAINSDGIQTIISGDTLAITAITNLIAGETDYTWDLGLAPACTKPNAGADQAICAGTSATLTGATPTTGTWTALGSNASGATLGSTAAGIASVSFINTATGNYSFIYTVSGGCSDTTVITVNNCAIGSLGNYVWYDTNNDGLQNEPASNGINGVKVYLYKETTSGSGVYAKVDSTITANNAGNPGYYNFLNLSSANYQLQFPTTVGNYPISTPNNQAATTDGNNDANSSTGFSGVVAINTSLTGLNVNNPTIDAGYRTNVGSLGNYVWTDIDGNGLQNELASNGINGVKVYLLDGSGNKIDSTVTANDGSGNPGYYNFPNLNSGNYQVQFPVTNAGFALTNQIPTSQINGNSDANITTGISPVVTLNTASSNPLDVNNPTIDAGYIPCASPNAGADVVACGGTTVNITASPNSGTWSALSTNPVGSSLGIAIAGSASVTFATTAGGTYSFVYTVTGGCKDTMNIVVTPKPNAGLDQTVCAGTSLTLPTISFVHGSWSQLSSNPAAASFTAPIGLPTASVTFSSSANGLYGFVAMGMGCTDTVIINVKPTSSSLTTRYICNSTLPFTWNGRTYNASTTDTVRLTNSVGCDSLAILRLVVQTPNCFLQASYTINQVAQCVQGNSFSFTSTVTGNTGVLSYLWNFGDGTTSTAANPTHTYATAGEYDVTLVVTEANACIGSCTAYASAKQVYIGPKPTVNFDWQYNGSCLTYDFNSNSTVSMGWITNRFWDFGNGQTSTQNNPLATFAAPGVYNVKLVITTNYGCKDSIIFPVNIINKCTNPGAGGTTGSTGGGGGVSPAPCSAGWWSQPATSNCDSTLRFNVSNTTAGATYTWSFGDGTSGTGNPTTHKYAAPGNYLVKLVVEKLAPSACKDSVSYNVYVSNCSVTGGGGGGIETRTLGNVIASRLYGKSISNQSQELATPTTRFTKSMAVVNGPSDLKLSDLIPASVLGTDRALISSPTDLVNFTNALEVLSVDYKQSSVNKAVAFATRTAGEVYSHTKPICDRLKGAELQQVRTLTINGYNVLAYQIRQRTGEMEYAINLNAGVKVGRSSISVQSNWFTDSYVQDETMFNFQLWAVSYDMVGNMAKDILSKLQQTGTVQSVTNTDLPAAYVSKGNRAGTKVNLTVQNNTTSTTGYFELREKQNEGSVETVRTVPFTVGANKATNVELPVQDYYEGSMYMYVGGKLTDLLYLSDGTWSLDYNKNSTTINRFDVQNETNPQEQTGEYRLMRNVQITGTTKDYISVYKTINGGGVEQNLSNYKGIKFVTDASGLGQLKVTIVKKGVQNWADQYSYTLNLDGTSKEYAIGLSQFKSSKTPTQAINANDVLAVNFGYNNTRGGSTNATINLSKVRFTTVDVAAQNALQSKTVSVYPNPVQTQNFTASFTSEVEQAVVLRVVEIATGKTVKLQFVQAKQGKNQVQVQLDKATNNGLYSVQVQGDNGNYEAQKLMINRK